MQNHTIGIVGGLCIALGIGFIIGAQQPPRDVDSELATAQMLAQNKNVRLIGFYCGNHDATVLAEYDDEFPSEGCKMIVPLRADKDPGWRYPVFG